MERLASYTKAESNISHSYNESLIFPTFFSKSKSNTFCLETNTQNKTFISAINATQVYSAFST